MVDYRPMVDNIDPLAGLQRYLALAILITWDHFSNSGPLWAIWATLGHVGHSGPFWPPFRPPWAQSGPKDGPKWSIWPRLTQMAQSGPNGSKWPNRPKVAQSYWNGRNDPGWPKVAQIGRNWKKWPKLKNLESNFSLGRPVSVNLAISSLCVAGIREDFWYASWVGESTPPTTL